MEINVTEYRRAMKNGQSREISNTRRRKQKHNTICVGHHYTQANTNNANKTWAPLHTAEGKHMSVCVQSLSSFLWMVIMCCLHQRLIIFTTDHLLNFYNSVVSNIKADLYYSCHLINYLVLCVTRVHLLWLFDIKEELCMPRHVTISIKENLKRCLKPAK